MLRRDIIVIGGSAGGVEALETIARTLPASFDGSIFATLHFPEHGTSLLPAILSRVSAVPASHATDGEAIMPGRIYVASPDYHLLLTQDRIRLVRGPRENGSRPAVDVLFRSAALAFGRRVIGVVLTGNLDDGTAGLAAIKRRGGIAVVQDPDSALFPSMPRSALDNVAVDRVVSIQQLTQVLIELMVELPPDNEIPPTERDIMENELAAGNVRAMDHAEEQHPGVPSAFSCPDCGGVLWELHDGEFTRFRCRVGHAWTANALYGEQARKLDEALWTALRALEESAALSRRMAARHRARGSDGLAARFEAQADQATSRAGVIRDAIAADRELDEQSIAQDGIPKRAS